MNGDRGRNDVVRHLTDHELAGVSGGMTVVEGAIRAAALMRGDRVSLPEHRRPDYDQGRLYLPQVAATACYRRAVRPLPEKLFNGFNSRFKTVNPLA
jgi:hypothetical protein